MGICQQNNGEAIPNERYVSGHPKYKKGKYAEKIALLQKKALLSQGKIWYKYIHINAKTSSLCIPDLFPHYLTPSVVICHLNARIIAISSWFVPNEPCYAGDKISLVDPTVHSRTRILIAGRFI